MVPLPNIYIYKCYEYSLVASQKVHFEETKSMVKLIFAYINFFLEISYFKCFWRFPISILFANLLCVFFFHLFLGQLFIITPSNNTQHKNIICIFSEKRFITNIVCWHYPTATVCTDSDVRIGPKSESNRHKVEKYVHEYYLNVIIRSRQNVPILRSNVPKFHDDTHYVNKSGISVYIIYYIWRYLIAIQGC